jgi:DNA-binding MarR family transcriptional regulator
MQAGLAADLVIQTLRTTNTFLRASRRLFRPLGLTEAQFNVLNVLARSDGGMSQRELSDYLVVDRSNITGLLDRMETGGWTRRGAVPDDRRAWRVVLTTKGRRLWEKVVPLYEQAVAATVGILSVERARATLEALRTLEAAAEAVADGAAGKDAS